MTKSKTWEEQFDEMIQYENNIIIEQKDDGTEIRHWDKLKDFIASQIEKTRREEASVTAGYCELAKQDGFKAGLQRAIELVPEDKPDRTLAEHMAFQDACMRYVENLKKELEK